MFLFEFTLLELGFFVCWGDFVLLYLCPHHCFFPVLLGLHFRKRQI